MSVYIPADSGLPTYFLPMLDDHDRNDAYSKAIVSTIERFVLEQGRRPRVLDLGCGTGMLSLFALRAGAEHVTCLDINREMCTLTKRSMLDAGIDEGRYEVVHGTIKEGKVSE